MNDTGGTVGYVVLTKQLDGSWLDDWDGYVHASTEQAISACIFAKDDPDADSAEFMVAKLTSVVVLDSKGSVVTHSLRSQGGTDG